MVRCVVYGCSNTPGSRASLHEWPVNDAKRSALWQKFVNRTRAKWPGPSKYSYVCSTHFHQDSFRNWTKHTMGFDKKLLLKNDAVPSIYPSKETSASATVSVRSAVRKREVNHILKQAENKPACATVSSSSIPTPSHSSECVQENLTQMDGAENSESCLTSEIGIQTKPRTRTVGTLTEERYFKQGRKLKNSIKTQTDPPVKKHDKMVEAKIKETPAFQRASTPIYSSSEEDEVDLSDMSWRPDSETEDLDDSLNRSSVPKFDEPKYIVFRSKLWELLEKCPLCNRFCSVKDTYTRGTMIQVLQSCSRCNYSRQWNSQPTINNIAVGNLLLSASITFSGLSPTKCLRLLDSIKLACISTSTYKVHNRSYIHPTVWSLWKEEQDLTIEKLKSLEGSLECAGDGRADSPGHCAKYGTYTLLETRINKIVTMELVQSNEVGNSAQMEKQGLIKCLEYLNDNGLQLGILVTDRHPAIQKMMREKYGHVRHYYDIWHVAKGFSKKAEALAKQKDCDVVRPWIKSLVNHLYWTAVTTPDGDPDIMERKWRSVASHIQDLHNDCAHGLLDVIQRRKKKWLQPYTKACEKLCDLILNTRLCKDVRKLSPAPQTSSVEAVHSLILHWTPKHTAYGYRGMLIRHFITCLHFNENSEKQQKMDSKGNKVYSVIFPKAKKGDFTLRKIKCDSTYEYLSALYTLLLEKVMQDPSTFQENWQSAVTDPPSLAASYVHPDKELAIEQYQSMTRYR